MALQASPRLASAPLPPSPRSRSVFYTWMPSPLVSEPRFLCLRAPYAVEGHLMVVACHLRLYLVTILQSFLERTNVYTARFSFKFGFVKIYFEFIPRFRQPKVRCTRRSLSLSLLYFSSTISGVTRFLLDVASTPFNEFFPPLSQVYFVNRVPSLRQDCYRIVCSNCATR